MAYKHNACSRSSITRHDFASFEANLKITHTQIQKFCQCTGHSIRALFRLIWVVHRFRYEGKPSVSFCELDSDLSFVAELSYQVDERQVFSDTCCKLEPSTCNAPTKNRVSPNQVTLSDSAEFLTKKKGLIAVIDYTQEFINLKILFDETGQDKRAVVGSWHTFDRILQVVTQNIQKSISEVDLLSEHDRNQLIAWNTPLPDEPQDQTICSHLRGHVRDRPDAPAIYAWDGTMTYLELDQAAEVLSLQLSDMSVTGGDVVLFCVEKSKWALVAALAILKAGAALVPIDPDWPPQRLISILAATETDVVVCSRDTRPTFDGFAVRCLTITTSAPVGQPQSKSALLGPTSKHIAFILFSSGSTGVPKGMIREHGTACIGSLAHAEAMHIDRSSRVLQFANHVFDVAMLDFFTTLIVGGCVCIPSEFDRKNNLAAFIQRSEANWVLLTPTVAGMLDPASVPSLRDVTLGGEAVTATLINKWLPYCRVGINYGSAEVDVTHTRDVIDSRNPGNVGKRIKSCICYVVDPDNPCTVLPIGAIGELLISGPTMARAYLKQPEKTAMAFIEAPVNWYRTSIDGRERSWLSRAYRMGDLVQQKWDGSFEFVGRRDFQVKIRGQKVELGEIESHLATHHLIQKCAVVYPQSGPFANRLVAVVERCNGSAESKDLVSTMSLEGIQHYLSQRLAIYMMPQTLVIVDPMPLTATLKIDRQKLMTWLVVENAIETSGNALKSISAALHGSDLASDDYTALKISALIADLVTTKRSQYWEAIYGHENSFTSIGIDSVQVMRLSHLISMTYGVKIPVEVLTTHDMTVKRLGVLIDRLSTAGGGARTSGMTVALLRTKLEQADSQLRAYRSELNQTHYRNGNGAPFRHLNGKSRVLLTGATGYLGIQILRYLLESVLVENVYVVVRGTDVTGSRLRLAKAAEKINWSIEPYAERLDVWQGELSQSRLGLHENYWKHLTNQRENGISINCLIHCGAAVDWTKSYSELEAANVTSTTQLLSATLGKRYPTNFVYVSGGQYLRPGDDDVHNEKYFEEAATSTGYAQTKFISEQIVACAGQQFNTDIDSLLNFHTVKPGYLIGSSKDGMANTSDYLWRVVAAAIRQRAYNADENEQWLLAGDVWNVAKEIVERAVSMTSDGSQHRISSKILTGIKVSEFWAIAEQVTGIRLVAVSGEEWLISVKTAMVLDPQHVLWPLLDAVEENSGLLTNQQLPANKMVGLKSAALVTDAVRKNMEYLVEIGFLMHTTPGTMET